MASLVNFADEILSSEVAATDLSPENLAFPPGFGSAVLYGHNRNAVPVATLEHVAPGAMTVPVAMNDSF